MILSALLLIVRYGRLGMCAHIAEVIHVILGCVLCLLGMLDIGSKDVILESINLNDPSGYAVLNTNENAMYRMTRSGWALPCLAITLFVVGNIERVRYLLLRCLRFGS